MYAKDDLLYLPTHWQTFIEKNGAKVKRHHYSCSHTLHGVHKFQGGGGQRGVIAPIPPNEALYWYIAFNKIGP